MNSSPALPVPGRPATMADVARRAGVSVATVSRALSGTRAVAPALRERVLAAAGELDYRVNLVGRALRMTRTSTVGLVVPDMDNPFFSALAQHLARAFSVSGYDLLVFSADGSLETELRGVRSFLGRQVDALVMIPVNETDSAEAVELAATSARTVQLDRRVPRTAAGYVGVSNRDGMRMVHDHVTERVDRSRQPVVFVGAEPTSSPAHERLDGFRQWFGDDAPALLGSFSVPWGRAAASRLLADGWRSGTIVTAADVIALGVVAQLLRSGHAVPEEFRVIGFDGIGVADLATPTLTTVRQPVERMVEAIRDAVLAPFEESDEARRQTWYEPHFVLGETSP